MANATSKTCVVQHSNTFGGFEFTVEIDGPADKMTPTNLAKMRKAFRDSISVSAAGTGSNGNLKVQILIPDEVSSDSRSVSPVANSQYSQLYEACADTGLALKPVKERTKDHLD